MRDYQSMGGMEPQGAGAPSYATPNRGQDSAYGAELRFGTPTSSVIARVPNISPDQPAGMPPAEEGVTAEHPIRALLSRRAIAGVLGVVLMAAVSPWIVGLLRDKTETGGSADAKNKAPDVRVELPAPNDSTAPAWGGANNDPSHWQNADSRTARSRADATDPDDADIDADADYRDARRAGSRRSTANLSQEPQNARGTAETGRDDPEDSRSPGRYAARPAARRTAAEADADRGVSARASGIAGRTPARSTTLSERATPTPPASDRHTAPGGSASEGRSRYDSDDARGDLRTAGRSSSRYDVSESAADRPLDTRSSTGAARRETDSPARDRDDAAAASRRAVSSRDRSSADAITTAYQDDVRTSESGRSRTGSRSTAASSGRYDEGRYAPATANRAPAAGRFGRDDREEMPYGFSRRDAGGTSSRAPQAGRGAEPADSNPRDETPRYPETRSKPTDRDDYGGLRSSSNVSTNEPREVRSASYESADPEVARFQGGIEEPTYRTSYERPRSSIR
jgi:hypothetical protein